MALITIPFTFSAGAVIIASQHNSNFTTISSDYNGNIDNNNIAALAAIAYTKLNLTGSIVNADISASAAIVASKLVLTSPGAIGSVAPNTGAFTTLKVGTTNQGDILYDNGTSLIRLTPGTSGQYLKTQGAAANPIWATVSVPSNVLFQYSGVINQQGAKQGEVVGATLLPSNQTGNYRFLQTATNGSYTTVWTNKWIKFAGVSTVTIYTRLWVRAETAQANLQVDIGGQTGNVSGTADNTTPEWKSFTIDVSGLSNGTAYDVTCGLQDVTGTQEVFCANIMGFGS